MYTPRNHNKTIIPEPIVHAEVSVTTQPTMAFPLHLKHLLCQDVVINQTS